MAFCLVSGCRFANSHLTKSHQCGKCKQFGHGQVECGNYTKINNLIKMSRGIRFPENLRCQSPGCRQAYSHCSDAHICSQCSGRHFDSACIQSPLNPTSDAYAYSEGQKELGNIPGKVFVEIYAGMGCQWFIKRDSPFANLSIFFMHSDCWGQYGIQCDDRAKLVQFLSGYIHAKTKKPFVLPVN